MKKIIRILIAVFTLSIAMAAFTGCGSENTLTVATNAEFPPFEYKEGRNIVGIDIAIAQEIANDLGMKLKIVDMPFDSVVTSVQTGKSDLAIAGLTITEDRQQNIDFSNPYFDATQYIIVKNTDNTFSECTTAEEAEAKIASLSSPKIGVQNGTTGYFYAKGNGDWFEGFANATVSGFTSGALAVADLIGGKLDMVIIDKLPAKSLFSANSSDIKLIEIDLTQEEYAVGIAKNRIGLTAAVNATLERIIKSGRLDEIKAQYIK